MYIDPKSSIADQPALRVRAFLRREGLMPFGIYAVQSDMRIGHRSARLFIKRLGKLGLVRYNSLIGGDPTWVVTPRGRKIANASAAKPILRATAERKLTEFINRVHQANRRRDFIYRISKVAVFGSFLSKKPRINDIDLCIQLIPKYPHGDRFVRSLNDRLRVAFARGQRFRNVAEEVLWPRQEVLRLLKSRSRSYSFHDFDECHRLSGKKKIIFRARPEKRVSKIPSSTKG